VNSLGLIDLLQIAAAGLEPGQEYALYLVDSLEKPRENRIALTKFTANPSGAAIAQAIGPLKSAVDGSSPAAENNPRQRYLIVTPSNGDRAVLNSASKPRKT